MIIIKYKININELNVTKNIQVINLHKHFNKLVGFKKLNKIKKYLMEKKC